MRDKLVVNRDGGFGSGAMVGGEEESKIWSMMVLQLPDIKTTHINSIKLTSYREKKRDKTC